MALSDFLDQIVQNTGLSPRDRSIDDSFKGLNITGRNNAISLNTENHGYTFFTKPLMNLSDENCMVDRGLSQILNPNVESVERRVRAYLDPRQHQQRGQDWCPGVDVFNPFIPLLSNNLISLTGWEDFTINLSTTTPGVYRDAMSYVDDIPYQFNTYDLQMTTRNIAGDPISWLFFIWLRYMGLNNEGRIMPHIDLLLLREFDANTRVYRLIMDSTKTYVTRIAASGASLPMNTPTGQILNFTGDGSETPYQTAADQLNFSIRCMGTTIYDHILIYEFNDLVETFNPAMRPEARETAMVKLQPNEKNFFNFSAYPWINVARNMELEWYVWKHVYEQYAPGNITKGYRSE